MKIKEEQTFYNRESDFDHSSEEEENYFTQRQRQIYKPGYSRRYQYQRRPEKLKRYVPEKTVEKIKGKNPVDKYGRITRCTICDSVNHWQQECPDKTSSDTLLVHEIVLHNIEETGQLLTLVSESWNCGLLDCGANKTVCGETWLKEYTESLNEDEKQNIKHYSSKSIYRFGDGDQVQATRGVSIPAVIGSTKVQINTDIINKELPLLLSKSFMKRASMVIDFKKDTASALGEVVNLETTSSGHYIIPLSKPKQLMMNVNKNKNVNITLISRKNQTNKQIALRLHRQFAHASLNQLLSLLKKAGNPWSQNKELHDELQKINKECETCQRYRKTSPRPVVGLPMATKFQETVAMDLKFYKDKIILHMMDLCTRLSAAATLRNKHPGSIVESILKIRISVYGSSEKFLVDNGGEFANNELISLAKQFGITIKTTAAESP